MEYLQDIHNRNSSKRALTTQECYGEFKVPTTPEFSVRRVYDLVKDSVDIDNLLPDHWTTPKKVERAFFFKIVYSLFPAMLEQMKLDADLQRYRNRKDAKKRDIKFCDIGLPNMKALTAHEFEPSKYKLQEYPDGVGD